MRHLVMFDIDGTLTLTTDEDARCYVAAMEAVTGAPVDQAWDAYPHVTDAGIAHEVFRRHGLDPAGIPNVQARFFTLLERALQDRPERCGPVPGAVAFFEDLRRDARVTLGIATGGWGRSARYKLAHSGFEIEDVAFASADDAHARVDIMAHCLRRAGGPFDRITYLGDGSWDVEASAALGWDFIGIGADRHGSRLRALGVETVFHDYRGASAIRAHLGLET